MAKLKHTFWILVMALLALAACAQPEVAPATEIVVENPSTTNTGGLDPVTRLALGTLKLEGTGSAVSVEQAAELLPLWKVLESGTLQGEAENAAIVKQIEGKMAAEQLAAIEKMGLAFEDTRAWMEEQGIAVGLPAGGQGGQTGRGGQAPGALQSMSEDERAKMREELSSMSAEQRATRMAEMGIQRPEGQEGGGMTARPGAAGRQANVLVGPLVELLTERSAG